MKGIIAPILVIAVIGALFLADQNGYRRGFNAHEVAAQAQALKVHKQSLATEERLHAETKDTLSGLHESTQTEIAAVRAAEAKATAEAEAHARRADDAEATAGRALAKVDELQGQTCPAPAPDEPCPFLCVLPDVPQ